MEVESCEITLVNYYYYEILLIKYKQHLIDKFVSVTYEAIVIKLRKVYNIKLSMIFFLLIISF